MKLSIVLTDAGYRERFHFLNCLHSQTFKDFEVIWCDYYGKIRDIVTENVGKFKNGTVLKATDRGDITDETPYNEAKAINYAISKAKGELIMKIDADLLVQNDFLEKIIAMHNENKKLLTSGIDKREPKPPENRPFTWHAIEERAKIENLTNYGSCLTTRKEHLQKCNGWDEDDVWNGVHFPSKDMGWRLINYGLSQKWYYDPPSLHPWHPTHHNTWWEIKNLARSAGHHKFSDLVKPTHQQLLDSIIVNRVEKGIYYVEKGIDKIK